jgi:hypothetical protein
LIFTMRISIKLNYKFHNSISAEVDLFLCDGLKNLRLFLLKRFWFFISIKVKRNQ